MPRKKPQDVPFKTRFFRNRKGNLVGKVPQWWANIHFDTMLVRFCFPNENYFHGKIAIGRQYKVRATSIGAKGTTVKVSEHDLAN